MTDVESLLSAVLRQGTVSSAFMSKPRTIKPELVLLFLEPHLRVDQVASYSSFLPTLKSVMQNSASSLHAPHLDLSQSLVSAIANAVSRVHESAKIVYAGRGGDLLSVLKRLDESVKAVSLANLKDTLSSLPTIFSNGVTDFVIINLEQGSSDVSERFQKTDAIIQTVQAFVSKNTPAYVSLYTGLAYDDLEWTVYGFPSVKRDIQTIEDFEFVYNANNMTNGTQPTWFQEFFPGWFWEATLFLIFLIPIILTGYCCLMSIQAPDYFIPPSKDKFKKRV